MPRVADYERTELVSGDDHLSTAPTPGPGWVGPGPPGPDFGYLYGDADFFESTEGWGYIENTATYRADFTHLDHLEVNWVDRLAGTVDESHSESFTQAQVTGGVRIVLTYFSSKAPGTPNYPYAANFTIGFKTHLTAAEPAPVYATVHTHIRWADFAFLPDALDGWHVGTVGLAGASV